MKAKQILGAMAALAGLAMGSPAAAQLLYGWDNPAGGSYSSPGNWFPFGVPNTLDEGASFELNAAYEVDFVSDVTASEAAVYAGTVTFDLDAGGNRRTYNVASLTAAGIGHLIIDDGTVRAGNLVVQNTGKVTVTRPSTVSGSHLIVTGDINVNGGSVMDQRDFNMIPLGNHTQNITVQNGGAYRGMGATGTMTVTGAGSILTTILSVGVSPSLSVQNGGAFVGNHTGSATITGIGSTYTGVLGPGSAGEPSVMSILDGGRAVSESGGFIGVHDGYNGAVVIQGAGSSLTVGGNRLAIGGFSPHETAESGRLTIGTGATVDVANNLELYPPGQVELSGGTLDVGSVVFREGPQSLEQFRWLAGTLHVDNFAGTLLNEAGTLAPGSSIGTTAVGGSYAQFPTAELEIEIGGPAAGAQHDVVNISYNASISGQLQLVLVNDFVPTALQTFTILEAGIQAGGLSGAFSNVATGQRLTTTDGLGSFLVHYGTGSPFNSNQVVLSDFVAESNLADLNMDGFVDGLDLGILLGNFNSTAAPNQGELNGTPPVDGLDLGILLGAWNPPTSTSLRALPEPSTFSLLIFSLVLISYTTLGSRNTPIAP